MIIDGHTHIFPDDMKTNTEKYSDDRQFAMLYCSAKGKETIADAALLCRSMEQNGINASIALGFTWQKKEYAVMHNEYLADAQRLHKGKIYAYGAIALGNDIAEQVNSIKNMGLYGVGEVAFYSNGFQEAEEIMLGDILSASEVAGLPVCLHINEPIGHGYPGKYYSDIRRIYALLSHYKNIPIICSHWGGGLLFYELMPEVRESLSHVYYDTAGTPFLYRPEIYSTALTICGGEKILFGSDYPLLEFSRYKKHIASLGGSTEYISYKNAQRLLGIDTIALS